MHRREMLLGMASLLPASAFAGLPGAPAATPSGWRTFEITTHVEIAGASGPTTLWLPLPWAGHSSYQRLVATQHDSGKAKAAVLAVPGYDARVLQVRWSDARQVSPVTLTAQVATRDRSVPLEGLAPGTADTETHAALQHYLRPTKWMPVDGMVGELAAKITHDQTGTVPKARALYEWVVQSTRREPTVRGCGLGDVVSLLKSGDFRGKCADINGLFVALARASGIPARDAYGIRVADSSRGYKSLGKSGDISKAQHCRAEFYAEHLGWVPVDPADVRKVMLEEPPGGLPFEDPKVQAAHAALFGGWEMNWIAYNHAHDVALPGSQLDPLPFLMYPQAVTGSGQLDCLDAAAFHYEIHSREVTA